MAAEAKNTRRPDLEAALGAMRTMMQASWIAEFYGSLLKAKSDGALPGNITIETLSWLAPQEIVRQAERQFDAMARLEKALGVELSFADGERPDDEETRHGG
jgi:hypothetical protein